MLPIVRDGYEPMRSGYAWSTLTVKRRGRACMRLCDGRVLPDAGLCSIGGRAEIFACYRSPMASWGGSEHFTDHIRVRKPPFHL
jgi:hypothetical protein